MKERREWMKRGARTSREKMREALAAALSIVT
jgi:hypothetical protein